MLVPAVVFTVLQFDKAFGKRDSALVWLAGLVAVLVIAAVRRSLKILPYSLSIPRGSFDV